MVVFGTMLGSASRRGFIRSIGRQLTGTALVGVASPGNNSNTDLSTSSEWDTSWVSDAAKATDRAIFDWTNFGDPAAPIVLQLADRYLSNCRSVYGSSNYTVRILLNVRGIAVPVALNDESWKRFELGAMYRIKDPQTDALSTRNPYWQSSSSDNSSASLQTLNRRGARVLVCDFALGHLAMQLATSAQLDLPTVQAQLRASLVPGAILVPSGIFSLVRAQNVGCGLVGG